MSKKLALFGGRPVIDREFVKYQSIGEEEENAVLKVMRSGVLSAYIASPGEGFMGGKEVRSLEKEAQRYFGVRHAIVVNSWTSGLIAAIGAIGIEPGDEVITTPWTMSATATAILHWCGIPIFADIDRHTFNIDPKSVERNITPRTKAVIAVDIFGQSADVLRLRQICDKYNLMLISDTAQAPGAMVNNSFAGTLADIGGFSLNYHKHIHCGEGGILVTNNDKLADRLRLIRNHAEVVINDGSPEHLSNMLGFNFRMGEIEASIARVQLSKLKSRISSRQEIAQKINSCLGELHGIKSPYIEDGNTHVYYVYGCIVDSEETGVHRDKIIEALRAEGVPGLSVGYQNIHLLPAYIQRVAYGTSGFPWTSKYVDREVIYCKGLCPIAEELHEQSFFGLNLCMFELNDEDVNQILESFRKVWNNLDQLRNNDGTEGTYSD